MSAKAIIQTAVVVLGVMFVVNRVPAVKSLIG